MENGMMGLVVTPEYLEREFEKGYRACLSKMGECCNAVNLMHYLDEHRPESKMCLSNGECAQIEKAWKQADWGTLIKYITKYLVGHSMSIEDNATALAETVPDENVKGLIRHAYIKGASDIVSKTCDFMKEYRQEDASGSGYINGVINDKTIEDYKESMMQKK